MEGLGLWLLVGGGIAALGALRIMASKTDPTPLPRPSSGVNKAPPRKFTAEELAVYDGTKGRPIYIAVQPKPGADAVVFDVTPAGDFYGLGGPYHVFAGKNASHGLGKMSTDAAEACGPIDELSPTEREHLFQWYEKYLQKYEIVGHMNAQ